MKSLLILSTQVGISKIHSLRPGCSLQFSIFFCLASLYVCSALCTPDIFGRKSTTFSLLTLKKNALTCQVKQYLEGKQIYLWIASSNNEDYNFIYCVIFKLKVQPHVCFIFVKGWQSKIILSRNVPSSVNHAFDHSRFTKPHTFLPAIACIFISFNTY
jgi:hypothetical protein